LSDSSLKRVDPFGPSKWTSNSLFAQSTSLEELLENPTLESPSDELLLEKPTELLEELELSPSLLDEENPTEELLELKPPELLELFELKELRDELLLLSGHSPSSIENVDSVPFGATNV